MDAAVTTVATVAAPFGWGGADTSFAAIRLMPGEDLRIGLQDAFAATGAAAGFIAAAVGSLRFALLRLAAREDGAFIDGPLEIVGLSGTFGPDGPHLHVAVADAAGRMTGGHLLPGCPVRTTAEVVLGLTSAVAFRRGQDAVTGCNELAIERRG